MLGEVYFAPPPNTGSVLAGTTLLQRARTVPPVSHGKYFLTIAEQSFYRSQQARWQLLYLVAKDLHQKPDIQALKTDMLQWPVSMHARLVLMAGAFKNTIWPLDSSYAEDKQKFWIALTEHGVRNFDSLYAAFGTAPLSAVTLEYLLLLPISAIVGYLVQRVATARGTLQYSCSPQASSGNASAIWKVDRIPDGHGSVSQLCHVLQGGRIPAVAYPTAFSSGEPQCFYT